MQIDDRLLADLALERGFINPEQLDAAMRELAATQAEPGKPAPSLAVILLTNGLLNEANLYELAQLWRARTMNPSDAQAPTPRVQQSPLRTESPTQSGLKAEPPDEPARELPKDAPVLTPDEIALATEQTLITKPPPRPKPATKDARAATAEHKAVRASSPELKPVQDPRKSTGHGDVKPATRDVKAMRTSSPELRAVQDPRKSTGHGEMKAVPAPLGKAKGPPKAPVPKKALTKADIELATQQTFVERKQTGELPPEAAEAAQYEDYCFKQFILTAELGKGGMGVVWKAWQRDLKRWVAIKFLEGESRDELERFIREAQSVALLSHTNITALYELNKFEENYYIVMEFVDGQTIESLMGKLSVDTCAKAFHQCALALDHAHRNNIIHRDIKPQNIMLTRTLKPYLMDFGLAKQRNAGSSQTMAGMILGTPAYMSPEQAEGKFQKIDKRSDVYSLAATMYAALAGRPPFQGRAVMDTLYKVVHTEPTPLRRINPKVPPELEAIVARAMSKTPAERYRDAREFAADLQRFMNKEPVAALSAPGARRTMSSSRGGSKTGLIIGVVIAVLAVLAVALVFLLKNQQSKNEKSELPPPPPPASGTPSPPAWTDAHGRAVKELAAARETLSRPGAKFTDLREHAERVLSIASEHPDVAELLVARGRALMLLRRTAEAETALKRAGNNASALLELGMIAAMQSDKAGTELFARAAAAPGDERDAKLARGMQALLDGRTREAIDTAGSLLEREPRAEYHWLRGRAHAKASNTEAADADYRKANQLAPHVTRWAEFAADSCYRRKDMASAQAILQKVLDFNPNDDDALVFMAQVRHANRDATALELASRAVAIDPKPHSLRVRGQIYMEGERYEEAIADFTRSLEKDPDNAEALTYRGISRHNKGDVPAGIADLERAVKLNPQHAEAHYNLARVAQSQGRSDDARRSAENLLNCRAATGSQLCWAAELLYTVKDYDRALAAANRASELAPDLADLPRVRINILITKKDYAKAEAEIRRAFAKDEFRQMHDFGRIAVARGEYESAIDLFTKAVALNPKSGEAYANRGNSHYRLQRWKEAVDDFKRAIELKPSLEKSIKDALADAEKRLAGG